MKSHLILTLTTSIFLTSIAWSKTICSITINSNNEINVFKKQLSHSPDIKFEELLPSLKDLEKDSTLTGTWFKTQCARKDLKCDALIISGHYGDAFTTTDSKNPFTLTRAELEQNSCNQTCPGILESPKEVFLFGCTTGASGARKDRTYQQQFDALIHAGFDKDIATRMVSAMYSSIGETSRYAMSRIFSNAINIHAFEESAPLGHIMQPYLESWLKNKKNYSSYLDRIETEPKIKLLKSIIFSGLSQNSELRPFHYDLCKVDSKNENTTFSEQLAAAQRLLKPETRFSALQSVEKFINQIDVTKLNSQEVNILNEIQNDDGLKKDILAASQSVATVGFVRFQLISLAKKLNWIDEKKAVEWRKQVLSYLFESTNYFDYSQLNLIIDNKPKDFKAALDLDVLPKRKLSQGQANLVMLRRSPNPGLQLRSIEPFADVIPNGRTYMIQDLVGTNPLSGEVYLSVLKTLIAKNELDSRYPNFQRNRVLITRLLLYVTADKANVISQINLILNSQPIDSDVRDFLITLK